MTAHRPVWAEVDLEAIAANVRALRTQRVAPAALLAVVKADGYGHGAVPVEPRRARRRRRRRSASRSSRKASSSATPASTRRSSCCRSRFPDAAETVVQRRLTPVVYTRGGIDALAKAVAATGERRPARRAPEGRHRHAPRRVPARGRARARAPDRRASGAAARRHAARTSRSPTSRTNPYTARAARALRRRARRDACEAGIDPGIVHACNTAGAIALPGRALRHGARRHRRLRHRPCTPRSKDRVALRPALSVKARVSYVKTRARGTPRLVRAALRRPLGATRIATVPIGYADGVPRALGHRGGDALVRGRRCADRRHGHDGPAHARRRRPARRGR